MSAASAKSQDPSMDEILASIRRIIADDQDVAKPSGPGAPDEDRASDDEAEVLDLADLDPVTSASPPPGLERAAPEISFRQAAEPAPSTHPAAAARPAAAPTLAAATPAFPPAASPSSVAPQPVSAQPAAAPQPDVSLVSDQTTAAVSHAFNLLSHTILSQNARTLEDLVGDMLKPMLKVWLDDNLPPLVERLVRQEIERVARGIR